MTMIRNNLKRNERTLLGIALATWSSLGILSCKTAQSGSGVRSDYIGAVDGELNGTYIVDWICSKRDAQEAAPDGKIVPGKKQDEYCEWDRNIRGADGTLSCDFRTTFDTRRKYWLPMRSKTPPWTHTRFSSLPDLIRLVQDCSSYKGATCGKKREDGTIIDCDATRNSDPEVCRVIQQFVFDVDNPKSVAPVMHKLALSTDNQPMIQIGLLTPLPKSCAYGVDPSLKALLVQAKWSAADMDKLAQDERTYLHCNLGPADQPAVHSCDDLSASLSVGTQLIISPAKKK